MDQPAPTWLDRLAGPIGRLAIACAALPLLALGGAANWILDLLSHFPHQCLLALLLALAVLLPARRFRTAALLLPSIALATARLWPLWLGGGAAPAADAPQLRAVAANLCYENATPEALAGQLAAFAPDLVALTEYTPRAQARMQALRAAYPHALEQPQLGAFGIALWSRLPLRGARVVDLGDAAYPAIVATIDTAVGEVGIVVAHPPPPGGAARSAARDRALAAVPALLADLPPRRLVLGDLNATRWSAPLRALCAATGLRDSCEGRGLQASWPASLPAWLGIAIDHALATPDLAVVDRRVGAEFGSDHRPVLVTFALRR